MLKFCGKDFKDMTNYYKLIQLTNTTIETIDAEQNMPLGKVTRRINTPIDCCNTFAINSSTADTITISDPGFYKVTYSLTAIAAAAGDVTISLITNDATTYTVSQAAADTTGNVNLTLCYTIRVTPNTLSPGTTTPVSVQLQNTGVALTSGTSNIIIEKV
jgi:hypothetical protein